MDRPYQIDVEGTIHKEYSDCEFVSDGDANADGVHRGIVHHGESLCTECIPLETRAALLKGAAQQGNLDAGGNV